MVTLMVVVVMMMVSWCGGVGDGSDNDGGDDDSGQNYKEFRWEMTDVETTQLQRLRSLGPG